MIDADATPYDNSGTKKEHVSWTYKGFDGYNPMKVYMGEEGRCIAAELRPGSWNGQRGFLYILERAHEAARKVTTLPLLYRLDSRHDALDNLIWMDDNENDCIIKWNKRKESAHDRLKYAEESEHWCSRTGPRPGRRVGVFTVYVERGHNGKTHEFRRVMRVTVRTIDKKGRRLLIPEVEVEGRWTTLELADEAIIALYGEHGTGGQYHSGFKTDPGLERLPSGYFNTNDLVLNIAMLTYNILKHIGLCGLMDKKAPVRHSAKRRRVKTVMQELVNVAVRLIERSRQIWFRFSKDCASYPAFESVYGRFESG